MKTPALALAALLLITGIHPARANLGDSEAQCITRYGAESDAQDGLGYDAVGDRAATFHAKTPQGSLLIRVIFLHGRSCHEAISSDDSSGALSELQMRGILDSQAAGQDWHKGRRIFRTSQIGGETAGSQDWQRSDGAVAKFWLSGKADARTYTGEMELATKQYTDAQAFYDKQDGAQ